jgi:hypothetical protein
VVVDSGIGSLQVVEPLVRSWWTSRRSSSAELAVIVSAAVTNGFLVLLAEDLLELPLSPSMVLICRFVRINAGCVRGSVSRRLSVP